MSPVTQLPGRTRDTLTTQRPTAGGTDAEGNAASGWTPVLTAGYGTWGRLSPRDQQIAAERNVLVDAAVTMPSGSDVRVGDQMTIRANAYTVVVVMDVIAHVRCLLRRVGTGL